MTTSCPEDLRYTDDHEWAQDAEGGRFRIGITHYAVEQLGDVTLVVLPEPGRTLRAGEVFGEVESVKTVSELYSPLSGTVTAVNSALKDAPEQLNGTAYDSSWLIEIEGSMREEYDALKSPADYEHYLSEMDA